MCNFRSASIHPADQLGSGASSGSSLTPRKISPLLFGAVGAGASHTCATALEINTGRGVVYCWGLNSDGQLGDGTTINRSIPTLVADYRP